MENTREIRIVETNDPGTFIIFYYTDNEFIGIDYSLESITSIILSGPDMDLTKIYLKYRYEKNWSKIKSGYKAYMKLTGNYEDKTTKK